MYLFVQFSFKLNKHSKSIAIGPNKFQRATTPARKDRVVELVLYFVNTSIYMYQI